MRRLLSLLITLSLFTAAQAQNSAAEQLFARFKAASGFDREYPREKVYLHLDNTSYLENDTVWYKAYVVRASTLQPTQLSRVLYVELLNADGQTIEKQTLQIDDNGQADGCFKLKLPVRAGYHEIRAYTREMTNWGTDACFSRIIPVFTGSNPARELNREQVSDITDLSIPEPEVNKKVTIGEPRPYVMTDEANRYLSFYPEGGHRVKGLEQRVAFKLVNGRGFAVDDTVAVYYAGGELLGEFAPEHEGMGEFLLPGDFGEGYALVKGAGTGRRQQKKRIALPSPTAGYSLRTSYEPEGLIIEVAANDSALQTHNLLGVAVINREKVCYFDTLTAEAEPIDILVPNKALRSGVNRVELFDVDGHSLSSRLAWVPMSVSGMRKVQMDVRQNKAVYTPFEPAVLTFDLKDRQGRPVKTTFSVAVRDRSGNITETADGGIGADLLLSSELRGCINRPDLYFTRDDAAHRRMLDLLLMVQGWTANTFEVMSGAERFDLKQPIEDKLILRGALLSDNRKREPLQGFNITFHAYSLSTGEALRGSAVTDDKGKFAFASNVNFQGDLIAQFTNTNENGKRKWSRLTLDRWFAPQPRPLTGYDLTLRMPVKGDSIISFTETSQPKTFEWKDTIPRTLPTYLMEAEITGHNKYHGFTGTRYTYNGGEKYGMSRATKFYNIQREVEHIKDMGQEAGTLYDVMSRLSAEYDVDRYNNLDADLNTGVDLQSISSTDADDAGESATVTLGEMTTVTDEELSARSSSGFRYKGRDVKLLINNADPSVSNHVNSDGPLMGEEVKSVAIVNSNWQKDAVSGDEKSFSNAEYTMYVYEIPDYYRYKGKKGIEKRTIQGFTRKTEFYAPNYRSFDLPTAHDVRRTLQWSPSVKTDSQGKAHIVFFTNSREEQHLNISVRGITQSGEIIEFEQ